MRSRIAKSLVAILLIISVGGHWAVLQSVAWVTMMIDYSKEAPISVAVAKTFDGKHPCKICHLVKRGQETEKKQESIKAKTKPDVWLLAAAIALPDADLVQDVFHPLIAVGGNGGQSPPVPPPRRA